MRYWWVNQNQTFKHEVAGGFLWSPKTTKSGARNQFYENMKLVRAGDPVFSFCDTYIKAVGTAQGPAQSATKPEFGAVGDQWSDEGWFVPVEFERAQQPVKPKEFIDELLPHMSAKYAPLQTNGNGNQVVYLAEISEGFAQVLYDKLGARFSTNSLVKEGEEADLADAKAQEALMGRTDIGPTQIKQLVSARRGQGIFRANVRLNETSCRITGISDQRFLTASHIKPWRDSNDQEKLDGCNGLLLSPHADKLFDRGFISFIDDGTVKLGSTLPHSVWGTWFPNGQAVVLPFNENQREYLAYHRTYLLE